MEAPFGIHRRIRLSVLVVEEITPTGIVRAMRRGHVQVPRVISAYVFPVVSTDATIVSAGRTVSHCVARVVWIMYCLIWPPVASLQKTSKGVGWPPLHSTG